MCIVDGKGCGYEPQILTKNKSKSGATYWSAEANAKSLLQVIILAQGKFILQRVGLSK